MKTSAFNDPRDYQIATLSALLIFGWAARAFEINFLQFLTLLIVCLGAQIIGAMMIASRPDFKSPMVTALSLTLLLRADALWPLALAATIAIGSKFTFRFSGKHIFNPACIGIVSMTLFTDAAWTTPGQWGTAVWFAALLAGAGMIVTYKAARLDVPLIFLSVYAAMLFGRALWLGDPLSIPLLRLENGALVLFAFFMISDPKTTPDGAASRAVFAGGAAFLAYVFTFHLYVADGLFYALALISIIRPLLEWADPAPQYQWGDPAPLLRFFRFAKKPKRQQFHLPAE